MDERRAAWHDERRCQRKALFMLLNVVAVVVFVSLHVSAMLKAHATRLSDLGREPWQSYFVPSDCGVVAGVPAQRPGIDIPGLPPATTTIT